VQEKKWCASEYRSYSHYRNVYYQKDKTKFNLAPALDEKLQKTKISGFMALYNCKVLYRQDWINLLSLSYNPLSVSLPSAQLLNAELKAREAAGTIFKVFGKT